MQLDPFGPIGPYKARLTGTHFGTAIASQNSIFDYILPSNRSINGCEFKAETPNFGDKVTFQVIIPVGHSFNPTQNEIIANEFATNWYVSNELDQIVLYRADIPAGFILRVIYNNIGNQDSKFFVNLFLHEKAV